MQDQDPQKNGRLPLVGIALIILFFVYPLSLFIATGLFISYSRRNPEKAKELLSRFFSARSANRISSLQKLPIDTAVGATSVAQWFAKKPERLSRRLRYLQIALNSTLDEAGQIISMLPSSPRIIVEAGTPLLKIYGSEAVSYLRRRLPGSYIVADNKCADLGAEEAALMAEAGANAATCLGMAPIATIDAFVAECARRGMDSMIDMMNVADPLSVLKRLKRVPDVVILHRGVDEGEFSREKSIPYYQIKKIKGSFDVMVAVAGGDTIKEVQSAFFNDAEVVVVWKSFYNTSGETRALAEGFLKEIK